MTDTSSADAPITSEPVLTKVPPLPVPAANSELVTKAVERIMAEINLDTMIADMAITGDLFHLAYNSVPTANEKIGTVRGKLSNMQASYATLCFDCGTEMRGVSRQSEAILNYMGQFYDSLANLREKTAIAYLVECGKRAEKMAAHMGSLRSRFTALKLEAQEINTEAHTASGEEEERRKALEREIAAEAEEKEAAEDREKRYKELYDTIQLEYAEVSSELATEQDRAFALQLTSAILRPLAEGLGAAAAIYVNSQTGGLDKLLKDNGKTDGGKSENDSVEEPDTPEKRALLTATEAFEAGEKKLKKRRKALKKANKTKKDKSKKTDPLESEIDELEDSISEKKSDIKDLKKALKKVKAGGKEKKIAEAEEELSDAEEELEELEDALEEKSAELKELKKTLEDCEAEIEKAETDIEELEEAIETLERQLKTATAAYEGVKNAAIAMANGMGEMSDQTYANVADLRKRKTEMFKLMLEQRGLELEAQSEAKKLLKRLDRLADDKVTIKATIRSIDQLIVVIKAIIQKLIRAELFWKRLAVACQDIADTELIVNIQNKISTGDFSEQQRRVLYASDDFRAQVQTYFSDWVALKIVSDDFVSKTEGLGTKVSDQFGKSLKGEARKALVAELVAELGKVLDEGENRAQAGIDLLEDLLHDAEAT